MVNNVNIFEAICILFRAKQSTTSNYYGNRNFKILGRIHAAMILIGFKLSQQTGKKSEAIIACLSFKSHYTVSSDKELDSPYEKPRIEFKKICVKYTSLQLKHNIDLSARALMPEPKETTYLLGTPSRSDHNFKYGEALMHLVKGYVGTGIFSMGDAMKNAGLIVGPITVLFIGIICLHCCHLLVNSAERLHRHFKLDRIPDYADTAKWCFTLWSPTFPTCALIAKLTVNVVLIMAQVGFCCCYLVFISWNIREVMIAYKFNMDIHWIIIITIIPLWMTCLIKTLKVLAKLSIMANFILLTSLVIVLYYAFSKPTTACPAGLKIPRISEFAVFFGQSIFAFEGVGLVLILYNEMTTPELFNETYGVLNIGLHIVTIAYIVFGAITYLQFGDDIKETVTLNLNNKEMYFSVICYFHFSLAQLVLFLISVGVSFSFALQLYVAVDIMWPKIVFWLGPFRYPVLVELWFRTALVITILVMAEAIPRLQILLTFVGSFLSVALIIIFPAVIDIVTTHSFQTITKFILIKDILLISCGVVGTIAGTYESLVLFSKEL